MDIFDCLDDRSRVILQGANLEARAMGGCYVGTEHVLLSVLKDMSSDAASILVEAGATLPNVLRQVEMLTKTGPNVEGFGELPMVPRLKQVVKYAKEEARIANQDWVSPEHLVLGLLCERDSVAFQILMNLRIDTEAATEKILSGLNSQPPSERDAEN